MRLNKLLLAGAVLALIGIIGAGLTFPHFTAIDGQTFLDQIGKSTGSDNLTVDKYQDYQVGDEIIVVDKIVRIESNGGKTIVWLDSIGKDDTPFIFKSNIMSDFGVGSLVAISLEVIKDSGGNDTVAGYENYPPDGIAPDSITTANNLVFFISVASVVGGIGIAIFGGIKGIGLGSSKNNLQPVVDDWGMPAAAPPLAAPPMASMPTAPPLAAPPMASMPTAPPSMAAIPEATAPPPANQPSTMTITVPPGVVPGQVLTVTMPSGQVVNVQVPSGSTPGSQFTITVQQ